MDAFEDDNLLYINGIQLTPICWLDSNRVVCRIRENCGDVHTFKYRTLNKELLAQGMGDIIATIGRPPEPTSLDYLEDMELL